jgi:hypothetical protein
MDTMLEIAKRVDDFMMDRSPVHDTMRRLAQTFGDLGIPFAIAGAMAANAHGHRRTTADVDVLVRREDLIRFKDRWIGRGWQDLFEGSKGFRDTSNGVKIDVLIVGFRLRNQCGNFVTRVCPTSIFRHCSNSRSPAG